MDLLNVYDSGSDDDSDEAASIGGSNDNNEDLPIKGGRSSEDGDGDQQQQDTWTNHFNIVSSSSSSTLSGEDVGFVRSIPHIRGNWSGHIFIELKMEQSDLDKLVGHSINEFCRQILSQRRPQEQQQQKADCLSSTTATISDAPITTTMTIVKHENLHISLSRPFFLQLASIESFIRDLQSELSLFTPFVLTIRTSPTKLRQPTTTILVNDEKTRSFYCWPVDSTPSLLQLIKGINHVMKKYRQPTYYDPPLFHVSVASIAGNILYNSRMDPGPLTTKNNNNKQDDDNNEVQDNNNSSSDGDDDGDGDVLTIPVPFLSCTFGTTKRYDLWLGYNVAMH